MQMTPKTSVASSPTGRPGSDTHAWVDAALTTWYKDHTSKDYNSSSLTDRVGRVEIP